MKRYVALLRGINVGGKNKIAMSALKTGFLELDFMDVITYLNSGNVIFLSPIDNIESLSNRIGTMIKDKFDLDIPVFIMLQKELEELISNVPEWWGNDDKEIYDNIIFLLPSLSYAKFYDEIGEPYIEYEKVHNCKNIVFWSFVRKNYQKTYWWSKTASVNVRDKITIRTANTIRKIIHL